MYPPGSEFGRGNCPLPNSLPGCCIDNLICSHAHYFEFCLAEIDQVVVLQPFSHLYLLWFYVILI